MGSGHVWPKDTREGPDATIALMRATTVRIFGVRFER
jgi:hypothetical protein